MNLIVLSDDHAYIVKTDNFQYKIVGLLVHTKFNNVVHLCKPNHKNMYVFVFESLREKDPKTGYRIHSFLKKENIPNEFHYFHSKEELFGLLDLVKTKASADEITPFVHIDCHGNSEGIGAVHLDKSEEFISWNDVLDKFIEVYKSSGRKSVISMSSCEGFNASRMVAKGKPCPYDHVCGSFEKIGFDDSFQVFSSFYKSIYEGTQLHDAAVALHNDTGLSHIQFMAINSLTLFTMMIEGYKKDQLSEEKLAERKAYLLKELKKTNPEPDEVQLEYLDQACSVGGHTKILQYYEEVFFS